MNIQINGEQREVPSGTSLEEVVGLLNLAVQRIAIELNHSVVRRAEWPNTKLNEGDRVEVVHFVGGGERNKDEG